MKNGMSVRKFLAQYPKATTKAVIRATGASAKTVYSMRWKLKQENKVVDLTAAGSPLRTGKIRMQGCGDTPQITHYEFGNSNVILSIAPRITPRAVLRPLTSSKPRSSTITWATW